MNRIYNGNNAKHGAMFPRFWEHRPEPEFTILEGVCFLRGIQLTTNELSSEVHESVAALLRRAQSGNAAILSDPILL